MARRTLGLTGLVFFIAYSLSSAAQAQTIFYEFSSGADGFSWPASPTGLLNFDSFFTPDNVDIFNDTGGTVFFDSQYQSLGNGSRINGDALWGNPLDNGFGGIVGFDLSSFNPGDVTEVAFDFAWSEAGVPAAPDFLSIYFEDSDGRASFSSHQLPDTFTGLGGSTGFEGFMQFDTGFLVDDEFNVDGGSFVDIAYMEILVEDIFLNGNNSEFAIDNFGTNGQGGGNGGGGELFASVNNGAINVNGSTNSSSVLRGVGLHSRGVEVTNGSGVNTTFSTALVPGGDLTDAGQVSGQPINDGQTTFNPGLATLDRSLPTGTYESDIQVINDGDPTDPVDTVTLRVRLHEAPLLSGTASPVVVSLGEKATLSNAAAPAGGFRASVKFTTGLLTTGPFNLASGFDPGTPVKPGEFEEATFLFNRFGQLSGTRTGQFIASVEMTTFAGINNDIEVFLADAETVPNLVWDLTFDHSNATSDNANISTGFSYFHILGVNTFDVAATLIDGTSSNNQNVSMQITPDPDPSSADLIGDAVDLIFGGGAGDQYTLQLTYEDGIIPGGALESELQLLVFNTVLGDWELAIDGNTAGTPTFFNGSYADYLAGPGGGVFDPADLGAYGIDTVNNHVWAVLDHASLFGVGVLTAALIGDLDADGFVGITDLNIVLGNWNQTVTSGDLLQGDPSNDGFVGIEDLNVVLGNWNAGTPPPPGGGSNIPEPTTMVLLGLGGLGLLRRRS